VLKHKVGDKVYIRRQEWMDSQEKDEDGYISFPGGDELMTPTMQKSAGRLAVITGIVDEKFYTLDISGFLNLEGYFWEDWMFKLEDGPLSARGAILAMLDGETLYDQYGGIYTFNEEIGRFEGHSGMGGSCAYISEFGHLFVSLNAAEV
jgi:hypothetical protein